MYKYYSCGGDNRNRIESRLLGEIYFSSPLKFNDPYDCQYPKIINNTKFCSKEKVKKILLEEKFDFESTYAKLLADDTETIHTIYKTQASRLGILCLSQSYNNILMWSHYAKNNGICLEYDISKMLDCLTTLLNPKRIFMDKVIYDKSLDLSAKLFFDSMDDVVEISKQKYWHKLKDWDYEAEFRIGVSLGGNMSVMIPGIVKHIYLGCNSTMEQIAKIYILTKKNKLSIPISIMNKTALGLEPVRLSTETLDDLDEKFGYESMTFWDEYENTYKKINNINNE